MSEFIVGLRGGIGTGKSKVSDMFDKKGIVIADADIAARRVVEPGRPAFQAIVDFFGTQVLQKDGNLDRAKLRKVVFQDETKRLFLESKTRGPIVQDLLDEVSRAKSPYSILVLSTGLGKVMGMNRLLVVDAPYELQIERVMARDNNPRSQVEAILEAQPPRNLRLRDADDIILNEGNVEHLAVEVEKLHQLYLKEARKHVS